jgi:hypothetical protein
VKSDWMTDCNWAVKWIWGTKGWKTQVRRRGKRKDKRIEKQKDGEEDRE